jgi:hypothetical protein
MPPANPNNFCLTESRICLPAGWIPALPEVDQHWISKALFRWSPSGQPEFDIDKVDRMWWYPPQQLLRCHPSNGAVLWAPSVPVDAQEAVACATALSTSRLWEGRAHLCGTPSEGQAGGWCQRLLLPGSRISKSCKRKVISWSHNIVSQLDIGQRISHVC